MGSELQSPSMPEMMKAAQFVELARMELVDAPIVPPREGELLVRSHSASICGSDLHKFFDGWEVGQSQLPFHPGYPGHEGVGWVEESTDALFAVGDAVLCAPPAPIGATFAEYQTIGVQSCVKLPASDLDLSQLLMAQQLGTVIFALRQHPADVVGRTVVIMGQGSAGLFFTWMLRRAGAGTIIVADKSDARLAQSLLYGADHAINVDRDDLNSVVDDLTGGVGADYLVEAVGRRESLLQSTSLVAPGSQMLWFGLPDSNEPIAFDFSAFFRKRLSVASIYGAQDEADLASFSAAVDFIARGDIDVANLVSHLLPIDRIQDAMEMAHQRTDNCLKVSVSF